MNIFALTCSDTLKDLKEEIESLSFIGLFENIILLIPFIEDIGFLSIIGETDNVLPFIDQADFIVFPVNKLLNGTNIKAAALTGTQFFS